MQSQGNTAYCVLEGMVTLNASHREAPQQCALPDQATPALAWDDNEFAPLHYTGTNTAGGVAAYHYVPDSCGDHSPGLRAATDALQFALSRAAPNPQLVFYGPIFSIDPSAVTCTPTSGTRQASAFTYIESASGTATQTRIDTSALEAFQRQLLEQETATLNGPYALEPDPAICPPGPLVVPGMASAVGVEVDCPAFGEAGWGSGPESFSADLKAIAGKTIEEAKAIMGDAPGIIPGSVSIIITPSGDRLPSDAGYILPSITWGPVGSLTVTPYELTAHCADGTYPTLTISNPDGGTVAWYARADREGITLSPASGTLAPGTESATVSIHGKGPLSGQMSVTFYWGGESYLYVTCV